LWKKFLNSADYADLAPRTQKDYLAHEKYVYMTGRTNGVATYRNSDFFGLVDGLHFALQYQGNNENAGSGEGTNNGGKRKLARENGDGFGIQLLRSRYGHQGSVFVF
jgi:predicted porin